MAGSGQPLLDVHNHFHSAVIEMIAVCDLVYAKNVSTIRKQTIHYSNIQSQFSFFLYEKLLKLSPVFAQCLPILLCEVADPAILTPPTHPLFLKDGFFFFHLSALKDYLWRFYNLQQAFLPRHTQGALVAPLASWRTCRTFLRQQKEPSASRQQGSFLNPDTG